jgi:hypothetical protein
MSRSELNEIETQVVALIHKAYQAGYQDARTAILNAVQTPLDGATHLVTEQSATPKVIRAPKGLMRKLVKQVLARGDGLPTSDVGEYAHILDERVSPRSAGTELKRGEEEGIYENEDGLWYLKGKSPASIKAIEDEIPF